MKVLLLAPYPPVPPRGGGQQRIYQFVRHLAREHEVWLLSFSPHAAADAALRALRDDCHVITVRAPRHTLPRRLRTLVTSTLPDMALRGRSTFLSAELEDLLARVPFDVVQAESIEMAQYGRRQATGPLAVYDAFNAEYLIQRRACLTDLRRPARWPLALYSLIQWQKLRRYEARLGRRFHGALAVSRQDAALLRRLAPDLPLAVVPNGVDTDWFRRVPAPPPPTPYLLFTGTLDYRPNIDALGWFAREVWPRLRAQHSGLRLVIVGRNPTAAVRALTQQPGIELVGEVDDVRPWFSAAAAYVAPMRIGGGVRLKVLEALAMEQAVVATSMALEGIEGLQPDEHALVADDAPHFAAQVSAVLHDHQRARRLGSAGRALVQAAYDWRTIVPRMVAAWHAWRAAEPLPRPGPG